MSSVSAKSLFSGAGLYVMVARIASRQQVQYMKAVWMRNIFFAMQLFIFASIWRVVYQDRVLVAGYTMIQSLWYLSFTEVIEMGKARVLMDMQSEVKDGTVAYNLLRPYNYVGYYLAKGMGESLVAVVPFLITGFIVPTLLMGSLPGYWAHIVPGLFLIIPALVLVLLLQIMVALLSFWIEESLPVYWILQKMVFFLGGLFFPLDFFPEWFSRIGKVLPFSYMNYWPARFLVGGDSTDWLTCLTGQLAYIVVFMVIVMLLYNSGVKRLEGNGG